MAPADTAFGWRAARASAWSSVDAFGRAGLQFALGVVLARLLSPEEFGTVAIVLVFSALGSVIAESGMQAALLQRTDASVREVSTAFWFHLASASLIGLLLAASGTFLAAAFHIPQLVGMASLFGLNIVVLALGAIQSTLASKRLHFRTQAIAGLVASLVAGSAAAVLAYRGHGVWALAWQALLQSGLYTAWLWFASDWRPSRDFDREALRALLRVGLPLAAARIIDVGYTRLYAVIIARMFGAHETGIFARAQTIQQFPADLMSRSVSRVALPALVMSGRDPSSLAGAMSWGTRGVMYANVPVMLGIALTSGPLIATIYGDRWLAAAPLLTILALSGILWPLQVFNVTALVAQGEVVSMLRIEILKKAIGVIALALACPWGLEAIAWSYVATACIAFFINTHYSARLIGLGAFRQLSELRWTLGAGAAMTATLLSMKPLVSALHAWQQLIILGGCGALSYVAAGLALRDPVLLAAWKRLPRRKARR